MLNKGEGIRKGVNLDPTEQDLKPAIYFIHTKLTMLDQELRCKILGVKWSRGLSFMKSYFKSDDYH